VTGQAFHAREEFPGEFVVGLGENLSLGVVCVAGGKAEGVFQDELEGGAGGFGDVQKNNHRIRAAIIGRFDLKVNPVFPRKNKTFPFRRRCQNVRND
jgi:hypothetical protein